MTNLTIAKLTELLEQQLRFNQTIINASVDGVCAPAHSAEARQLIKAKGGFASYVLDNSRAISDVLDNLRGAEHGDAGA